MTTPTERLLGWAAMACWLFAFFLALGDLVVGGLSFTGGIVSLLLVLGGLVAWIGVEWERDARVDRGKCTCSGSIRFGTPGLDPKAHRPSCPIRVEYEQRRRSNGCCGPPDRDPREAEHGSTRPLTKRQRRDWKGSE